MIMKITDSLKSFFGKCKRVWMVLKKPTKEEILKTAKISGWGIIIIGALGFIISIIINLIS